jgi:integrase
MRAKTAWGLRVTPSLLFIRYFPEKPMALDPVPTRSETTKTSYGRRTQNLLLKCRTEMGIAPHEALDHRRFVGWLITNKPNWSRNTWRQYKAAAVYSLEKEADHSDIAHEALEALLPVDVEGCPRKTNKTSAKKLKRFPLRDYRALDKWLTDHQGSWNEDLRRWLAAGLLTGLRPSEWANAKMTDHGGEPALVVKNAKATNKRAHGPNRTVLLGGLTDSERALIGAHVRRAVEWQQADRFAGFYHGCAAVLARSCRQIWPKRDKYPTLYSARHQFSADAKASGLLPEEIAALMGHAVDNTATKHYGRKSAGVEMLRVRPDPAEVARVRQAFTMRHAPPSPGVSPSPENAA